MKMLKAITVFIASFLLSNTLADEGKKLKIRSRCLKALYPVSLKSGVDSNEVLEMMTYSQAKEYVKQFDFKTPEEFWAWRRTKERPPNFPFDPDQLYLKDWEENGSILGFLNIRAEEVLEINYLSRNPMSWMSLEEAKVYIQSILFNGERISTQKQFRAWSKAGLRPSDLPASPDKIYKNQGWKGYEDFLGKH